MFGYQPIMFTDMGIIIWFTRLEVEQLRSGKIHNFHKPQYDKNDILTIKWLYNAVAEVKTEISEIQSTINSTLLLENNERIKTELNLLRSDISNLNEEQENNRRRFAKHDADFEIFKEEIKINKENWKNTAGNCGKIKNQVSLTVGLIITSKVRRARWRHFYIGTLLWGSNNHFADILAECCLI